MDDDTGFVRAYGICEPDKGDYSACMLLLQLKGRGRNERRVYRS